MKCGRFNHTTDSQAFKCFIVRLKEPPRGWQKATGGKMPSISISVTQNWQFCACVYDVDRLCLQSTYHLYMTLSSLNNWVPGNAMYLHQSTGLNLVERSRIVVHDQCHLLDFFSQYIMLHCIWIFVLFNLSGMTSEYASHNFAKFFGQTTTKWQSTH